ncbi:O-antigen polymerase [Colwellia sp. M166]|uniref:O-antigen ligase family protein n=1 Tax=Colwellia sp. M166 TaxID=2583805 RepID=UPI00211DB881|nr:O-antigen ligase family protein [Colwellia sp. M166]UUO23433.1 O-antigen polymerase [Colwellia sp. M166]|tara:strand:+ start:2850 stop:4157 length:1308 start_codon:yes stop_codon:yes gene_type:complete
MARYQPEVKDKNSTFAFFSLFLYAAAVLIRPHEMFLASIEWSIIMYFAIISFLAALINQRPLNVAPQHIMLFLLYPLIILSGFINGSGMWGISQANMYLSTTIIPLFLFSNCISSIKRQHWIMIVCLVASLCMIHNGHVQQTDTLWQGWALNTQAYHLPGTDARRITYLGFFSDPNDIGMFFVMNIPFILYFYAKGKLFTKTMMLIILVCVLYGVYITHSRGTALGVVALIGTYYLVMKAGKKLFFAALLFAPIALMVLLILQSNVDESARGRLEAWYFGIQMLISYPLGIGKGAFVDHHGLTAHNSYVLVAGELGFIGYCLWGGALVFTIMSGFLFIKHTKFKVDLTEEQRNELAINKTLFFSMTGFMVTGFFLSRSYTVLLFIFMGMTIASHYRVVKLLPELSQFINKALVIKSIFYSWAIIIVVYLALKIAL